MRIKVDKYIADKLDGLNKKDLRIDTFKVSGSGGQKRDKTDAGVRITHIETGVVAQCSEHRSQVKNRASAFRKLVGKLVDYYTSKKLAERTTIGFGEKMRTYHQPRNEVKDHRTGKTARYTDVLNGDLDDLIDAALALDKKK